MMLAGADSIEREAAARALVHVPAAGYQLRVAEWGVRMCDTGAMTRLKSELGQVPPFAHQTGDPQLDLTGRVQQLGGNLKPIIHLTVNAPMAVDITTLIRAGRTWYAFPRPDDFSISVGQFSDMQMNANGVFTAPLSPLDNNAIGHLSDCREGMPWLFPHHRTLGKTSGWNVDNEIDGIGVRWQSLIVSPQQLSWMSPPALPSDEKYAWWNALRHVPSAWISSRGESERFLYYDGPSLANDPYPPTLAGDTITINRQDELPQMFSEGSTFVGMKQDSAGGAPRREAMFVHVVGGHATVRIGSIADDAEIDLQKWPLGTQPAAEIFQQLLVRAGLTNEESAGMLAAWRRRFFETDGKRMLRWMSAREYDNQFPIQIRPRPTALVRVGVVWTEF
jgi:hypothetical protein